MEMTVFNFGRRFTKTSLLLNAARSMVAGWALKGNPTFCLVSNEPSNGSDGRRVLCSLSGMESEVNSTTHQAKTNVIGDLLASVVLYVILERETPSYCTDPSACNYGSTPTIIAECDYTCCPGPGCCHEGTIWDSNLQQCIVANPSDSNFDGCVQLNDLLDLLSAYGDCGGEESAWQCGDTLEYQGYDYETVQIGEQCWLRKPSSANYRNGDVITPNLNDGQWNSLTTGANCLRGRTKL